MPIHSLDFRETQAFSRLMVDYLDEDDRVKPFINRLPSIENLVLQAEEKAKHTIPRDVLVKCLRAQYSRDIPGYETDFPALAEALDKLENAQTFTVTTGHQLNLAGGPLFFLYKIAGAISLANRLNAHKNDWKVVPVFWMATEDHDWEEVNHFNYQGKKYGIEEEIQAAVGRADSKLALPVLDALEKDYGHILSIRGLIKTLKEAYSTSSNFAQATRRFTQELFKDYGLVILDGDDPELKAEFMPIVNEELFGKPSAEFIRDQTSDLDKRYFAQVNPREINLFYLDDRHRGRISRSPDGFEVIDGHMLFDDEQLKQLIKETPQKYSPNVVLRPLYQEMVLPNLAYIGGGGELAYWMQLKSLFEGHNVPFPVLMLRTSMGTLSEKAWRKIKKYDFKLRDLFEDPNTYIRKHFFRESPADKALDRAIQDFESVANDLKHLAQQVDPTLIPATEAELARQERGMKRLKKKFFRALKRREKHVFQTLEALREELFPEGGLQERKESIFFLAEILGEEMIDILVQEMDPLKKRFIIFEPEAKAGEG